jgi:hypothetical protein
MPTCPAAPAAKLAQGNEEAQFEGSMPENWATVCRFSRLQLAANAQRWLRQRGRPGRYSACKACLLQSVRFTDRLLLKPEDQSEPVTCHGSEPAALGLRRLQPSSRGGRTCPPPLFPPHSSRFRDACQEGRAECYTTVTILYVQSLAGQHPDSRSDSNQPANPASQPGVPVCTSSARDAYQTRPEAGFKHGGSPISRVGTMTYHPR